MKWLKNAEICLALLVVAMLLLPLYASGAEYPDPNSYFPSLDTVRKAKRDFDDPRPYGETLSPKKLLPPDFYAKLTYDVEKMKKDWAEVIGFRSPDIVGKIAPEIKPGKYTYKDLEKYPGFKELMWPDMYNRIKPGGPPFAGNIPEFEIIPTRQYYWSQPIIDATKRNIGKTKQDDKGYLIGNTWEAGYPFPQPSGPFKTMQIMYNFEKRYLSWENNMVHYSFSLLGFDKNLRNDMESGTYVRRARYAGRVLFEPYGWLDDRARLRGESQEFIVGILSPRDIAGLTQTLLMYLDPQKSDNAFVYVPALRRIRKMSMSDTQDPLAGQDVISDDMDGFTQKISPTIHPYKYELIGEREYLVPFASTDGSEYLSSKGLEFRGLKFERRPFYVVKLTQLDPNYVYGSRIGYIDKETFMFTRFENYDQKKRLYRSMDVTWGWYPEMGQLAMSMIMILGRDHLDLHSMVVYEYELPAVWKRADLRIETFIKQK